MGRMLSVFKEQQESQYYWSIVGQGMGRIQGWGGTEEPDGSLRPQRGL